MTVGEDYSDGGVRPSDMRTFLLAMEKYKKVPLGMTRDMAGEVLYLWKAYGFTFTDIVLAEVDGRGFDAKRANVVSTLLLALYYKDYRACRHRWRFMEFPDPRVTGEREDEFWAVFLRDYTYSSTAGRRFAYLYRAILCTPPVTEEGDACDDESEEKDLYGEEERELQWHQDCLDAKAYCRKFLSLGFETEEESALDAKAFVEAFFKELLIQEWSLYHESSEERYQAHGTFNMCDAFNMLQSPGMPTAQVLEKGQVSFRYMFWVPEFKHALDIGITTPYFNRFPHTLPAAMEEEVFWDFKLPTLPKPPMDSNGSFLPLPPHPLYTEDGKLVSVQSLICQQHLDVAKGASESGNRRVTSSIKSSSHCGSHQGTPANHVLP